MSLLKKRYSQATILADASDYNRGIGYGGGPQCPPIFKKSAKIERFGG